MTYDLRPLIERAAALAWTTDADLRLITVSGAMLEDLRRGKPDAELSGRSLDEIVGDADAAEAMLAQHRAIGGIAGSFDLHLAGRVLRCEVQALRDDAGRTTGVMGIGLDVTDRVQAERRLSDTEATYRALVEQIPAVVYIDAVDERSTALYSSPQVEAMLGYSPDEWIGDPDLWVKLLHDDDRARVLTASVRSNRSGEPFSEEYRLIARDGRVVWVRDEAVMVRDDGGRPRCWQGVMFDITDRKRTEENLERSLRMLRASDEERRGLLAHLVQAQEEERERISADIHDDSLQAMVALGIRLEIMERWIGDEEGLAELRDAQDTLRQAVERLRKLLSEVRPPLLDREGLGSALRLSLGGMRLETGMTCMLEDHLPSEPPQEIRTILYRIAAEALANVRKHAHANEVVVRLEERDSGVLLAVTDDGTGFAREQVEGRLPGHLGLVSMRERASVAGGWCRIDTTPGAGTSVEAWVPAAGPARSLAS